MAGLRRRTWVAGLFVVVGLSAMAFAQEEMQRGGRGGQGGRPPAPTHRVAGVRDGVSIFPKVEYPQLKPLKAGEVDFKHYHSYDETVALLKMWAAKYPDLVDLYSAGQSFEGREIWQITVTSKKTGKDTDKPAFFLEGGRHAGEISGIETTLYFINHVLTSYGTDPAITKLVDTKSLYLKPNNDPDGNTLYHLTAQTVRSTVRPYDSDGDGLVDEDAGEDLDGDGFLRQMRRFVGPGKGNAVKDPKDLQGRAMKRVPQGQGDYETYSEGIDNDLDGRYNEDGIGGLDLHRNYPENWRPGREATGRGYTQPGSGEFPLSEPETRAVFTFLMTHPNVGLAQSLDTAVPMILRGPSTASTDEGMYPEDAAIAKKFDKKGLEITGYPWAGDTYHVYATRSGVNPVTGEAARDEPIFGHGPDFGYSYYGVIWYGDEIWNGGRFTDYDKDGRIDEWEVLKWLDENRPGKGDFQPWTAFKHPQLGDVEIGGVNPKFWGQNPPPDMIETWARHEALFNLYLAQQLAQVKLTSVGAAPAKSGAGTFDVTATVVNEGLMPTALDVAKRIKMVRPDAFGIRLGTGLELVKAADGKAQTATIDIGWLKPGESRTVTWQVKGTGTATVSILSTRGGVDRKDIDLK
ncbi:MAG: M14 family metallopeptidase [Acidobacteria bacterium]|nr:M14 family metallopeptidase [Acidobacteriota bacterium]